MATDEPSAELALGWIGAWLRMDMDWLRAHLAEDFVHVSPLGRMEGRDACLAPVDSCDWVRVEGDLIREIRSFYDPTRVRASLSAEDQSHFEDME